MGVSVDCTGYFGEQVFMILQSSLTMAINNVIDHTTVQLELLLSVISEASLQPIYLFIEEMP